ncbi:MAG: hypothetical protein GX613_06915 [Chloroflexi bacterium]|nr:hypothetical protein [Chloroflexota bacterium]
MFHLSRWEKWIYRISFAVLAAFLATAALVIEEPTEARTNVFGVLLYVTLLAGVTSGIVAVYASNRRRG